MNIVIAKRDLDTALNVVSNTVASGGGDISTHYLFRARDGSVEILSYSGRTFSSCPAVATVSEGTKSFTVEAKRVSYLLNALADDAVLTFSMGESNEVSISTGRGKNVFASLDPDLFPYWDEVLAGATKTATIPANRLYDALSHAKSFVYDQEQKAPHLCVAEFRNGCLYSTDQMAVAITKVGGMDGSACRIFGKDLGSAAAFLSACKEAEVEVLESDRALFFKRSDGAVYGESKFGSRFPDLAVDWTIEDDYWWDLPKSEVLASIRFLAAGARWDDTLLRMGSSESGEVFLSMTSAQGKAISLKVKATGEGKKDEAPDLPKEGFPVSHVYISKVLEGHSGDTVRFGVSKKGKGGWVRFKDDRGPDTYLTTVAWMKVA
jgi:DNA polymerase III sliding clamp (beta) subunit (PCNA family)